jgi:hypothetical protein
MKRLFIFLISFVVAWSASANPISRESAQQKAADFISKNKALARGHHQIKLASASDTYYIFNIEANGGFIVVSGDDSTPEILGYSDEGSFDSQDMPDNMRSFLESLEEQIMAVRSRNVLATPQKTISGKAIKPLLENIAFNQDAPYNLKCPDGSGSTKCVTGCVAVAMAQIMRYWQYPAQTTTAIPDYTIKNTNGSKTYAGWDVTTIDWNNILPTYNGSESDTQKNAVATLLSLCGTSVNMSYGTSASSASSSKVPDALKTYFDYDASTRRIDRLQYRAAEWNQLIYDELQEGRPVLYSGQSSGGGHSFVVDGYDSDDYFHINWGWGGHRNNYFLLSVVDPGANSGIGASSSSDGYGFSQDAIIGIRPSTGQEFEETVALTAYSFTAYQTKGETLKKSFNTTRSGSTEDFTVNTSFEIRNRLSNTYSFEIGIGAFNSKGELVADKILFYLSDVKPGYGGEYAQPFSFGNDLTDGTYTIMPISRKRGTTEWIKDYGADNNNITAVISGNTLTVKNPYIDLSGTVKATGKTEKNSSLPLEFMITNNGTFFNNEIFLFVNGTRKGGKVIEVEAGKTVTDNFSFLPTATGSHTADIKYISGYNSSNSPIYTTIASASISVTEAPEQKLEGTVVMSNLKDDNTIMGNSMKFTVKITNQLDQEYDNKIDVIIWKHAGGTKYNQLSKESKDVKIAGKGTANVEFQIDNLEIGVKHWLEIDYYSKGESVEMCSIIYDLVNGGDASDVNGDGKVNVADIVKIVNRISNGDSTVNVNDIKTIVNKMMGK